MHTMFPMGHSLGRAVYLTYTKIQRPFRKSNSQSYRSKIITSPRFCEGLGSTRKRQALPRRAAVDIVATDPSTISLSLGFDKYAENCGLLLFTVPRFSWYLCSPSTEYVMLLSIPWFLLFIKRSVWFPALHALIIHHTPPVSALSLPSALLANASTNPLIPRASNRPFRTFQRPSLR